jgi:hypothetical protein
LPDKLPGPIGEATVPDPAHELAMVEREDLVQLAAHLAVSGAVLAGADGLGSVVAELVEPDGRRLLRIVTRPRALEIHGKQVDGAGHGKKRSG